MLCACPGNPKLCGTLPQIFVPGNVGWVEGWGGGGGGGVTLNS